MINNLSEINNLLQGQNGVQKRDSTRGSNAWSSKSESFMDILASTKKNTQEPSKKDAVPDQSEKVSSSDDKKKEPDKTKNDTENNNVDQTEQEKYPQEKPKEENEVADSSQLGIVAMLAGNVIVPPISQEVVVAPVEEMTAVVAESVVNMEDGSQQGDLPVEELLQENKPISNSQKQVAVKTDADGEIKITAEEDEGQLKMSTIGTELKEEQQPISLKPLRQSAEAQTEQKDTQRETIPVSSQPIVANTEQPEANAVKFNDSSSLLQRQVTQQVTDQIMSNIQDKQQQFTLSLHPDRLGQVAVKLLFEGGKVMVQVETHTQLAQHLLSAGATEIKALLESTGVQVDGVSIEQYMDQRQQDTNDSRNQTHHNNGSNRQAKESDNEVVEEANAEQIPVSSGLNYSI